MDIEVIKQYEAIIAIIAGVFLCLFGYRIKKVAFVIIWFLIGYLLAQYIITDINIDEIWRQIIPIATGVLFGMLGFSIEKLCIFAVATFGVSTTIIEMLQLTDPLFIGLAIAAGVIVGCIATAMIKPLGIITTALSGAKLIAKYSVLQFSLEHYPYFILILGIAFAIGVVFQFKNCRHIE